MSNWRKMVLCGVISASLFGMASIGTTSRAEAVSSSQAVTGFQGCALGATQPVDVLIIMDQTQSLRTTDPSNLRIIGLKAALRSMASEHDTNSNVTYRVRMVGFGRSVVEYGGPGLNSWESVTTESLSSLYTSTSRFTQPASGDIGTVTDFSAALRFADETLSRSSATCRAVLWFTDGALDVSNNGQLFPRTNLEKSAMGDICRPGGLTASLASDNIWNFAVGLTNRTGIQGADALASITRGGESNYLYAGACGESLNGATNSGAGGEFFQSPNSASLIFQMQGLVCTGRSCEPQALQPCVQGQSCPSNHQFPFWAGPGVASFTFDGLVKIDSGSANAATSVHPEFQITDAQTNESIVISMRGGRQSCSLANGAITACTIDGIRLSASSLANNEILIVGRVTSDASPGHALRGVFLLPSGVRGSVQYTFFVKSSIDLAFVPQAEGTPECPATSAKNAYVGCTIKGHIVLVDAITHEPVTTGHVILRNVHATLVSNKQDVVPVAIATTSGTSIPYSITIPNSATIGVRYLQASGVLDLSQNGVLQSSIDVSLQQPLSLIPAPGFPVISVPSKATLVNVGDHFSVPIRVTGSVRGDGGCIGIGSVQPSLAAPDGTIVKQLHTDIPRSCRSIGDGRSVVYHITGLLAKGHNGHFTATVSLRLGSGDARSSYEAPSVAVALQANVPVNVGGSIALLVLFLALAVLGILAMSLAVNVLTGRFAPLNLILSKSLDVVFTKAGLQLPDGSPVEFGDLVSDNVVKYDGERLREFTPPNVMPSLTFTAANLRKPMSWLKGLFRGPIATVSAGSTVLVTGGFGRKVDGPSSNGCTAPQDLNEFWVFSVTSVVGEYQPAIGSSTIDQQPFIASGSLTIFIRSGGGAASVSRVLESAQSQLRAVAEKFQPTTSPAIPNAPMFGASGFSPSSSSSADDDSSFSI